MTESDQQFLAIASVLTGERAFRRHVRWTHAADSVRLVTPFVLFGAVLAIVLLLGPVALAHVAEGLREMGQS